jgi:hypothetical protein
MWTWEFQDAPQNLQNDKFKEIYVVDEKKMDEEVSKDKPIPKPMSN